MTTPGNEQGGLENLPVLVAVRTALAGPAEGIFRELPREMWGATTVAQALEYALREQDLTPDERPWATNIRGIMEKTYSIAVGDRSNVGTSEPITDFTQVTTHPHPRGGPTSEQLRYRFADMRVATAQKGGLEYLAQK